MTDKHIYSCGDKNRGNAGHAKKTQCKVDLRVGFTAPWALLHNIFELLSEHAVLAVRGQKGAHIAGKMRGCLGNILINEWELCLDACTKCAHCTGGVRHTC